MCIPFRSMDSAEDVNGEEDAVAVCGCDRRTKEKMCVRYCRLFVGVVSFSSSFASSSSKTKKKKRKEREREVEGGCVCVCALVRAGSVRLRLALVSNHQHSRAY